MTVRPAPNPQNQHTVRWEAVNAVLMRRSSGGRGRRAAGRPALPTFITGMSGGYFMRRLRVSGERYSDEPEKNQYSHICEAGENMLLGGGEGRAVTMGSAPTGPKQTLEPAQDDAPQDGVMREVPAYGFEARRWTVVFHRKAENRFFSCNRDGAFQARLGVRLAAGAGHWLIYDVGFRRTQLKMLGDTEGARAVLAAIVTGNATVTIDVRDDELPWMRLGMFCTTAVAHLIGVRTRCVATGHALPPPRRERRGSPRRCHQRSHRSPRTRTSQPNRRGRRKPCSMACRRRRKLTPPSLMTRYGTRLALANGGMSPIDARRRQSRADGQILMAKIPKPEPDPKIRWSAPRSIDWRTRESKSRIANSISRNAISLPRRCGSAT
jgi:hypothetical protein